ncbi:MAG: HAD-IB family phosphatase [Bacilli bacterium]|nr:HAD-IB family phosphatase [Bacilli bacterium]
MKVNLYDFDNTIYKGDSSTDFFFYSLLSYPKIIKYIPKICGGFILYKLKRINKTKFKRIIFSYLKEIPNVDDLVASFWNSHECYIKDFYKNKKHDNDIIISASPEFLLKPICKKLKVKDLIASDVDKKTGEFNSLNCYGREKIKRLNKKYKNVEIIEAYSDSYSDTPMLEIADKPYIVKGNRIKDF